jgi:hypothetical protein
MNCIDSAEYVSALCDGEIIPASAAEHIGTCPECQTVLQEYLHIGIELRRTASLEYSGSVPPLIFEKPQNQLMILWQKGLATMRIPRFAFVLLVASLFALASSLAIVKVRAHGDGSVVLLSVSSSTSGSDKPVECPLSTVDKQFQECGLVGYVGTDVRGYVIHLLSRSDDRVELGVRYGRWPAEPGKGYGLQDFDHLTEQHYWFEPGDKLKIDNAGLPTLTLTGTWMDHVPSFTGVNEMDPGPDELRIISPLVLRDKQVIGDLQGGMATQTKPNVGVNFYFPKQGGFLISNFQIQGAIEAEANRNRISFEEDGHQYLVLTAAPITRAHHVWVLHGTDLNPSTSGSNGDFGFIGGMFLREIEPGIWVPKIRTK